MTSLLYRGVHRLRWKSGVNVCIFLCYETVRWACISYTIAGACKDVRFTWRRDSARLSHVRESAAQTCRISLSLAGLEHSNPVATSVRVGPTGGDMTIVDYCR